MFYVEVHDGIVLEIALAPPGEARVLFSRLAVYRPVGSERYEIRVHPARLDFFGVESVSLQGELRRDDYVSDGQVSDGEGRVIPWADLLSRRAAAGLVLQFGSGPVLRLACSEAVLSLEGEGKFVEIWEGALSS